MAVACPFETGAGWICPLRGVGSAEINGERAVDRWNGLKRWQKWLAAGGTTLVVLIIIGAIFGEDSSKDASKDAVADGQTTTQTTTATTAPAAPATTAPATTGAVSETSPSDQIVSSGSASLWSKMTPQHRIGVASNYIAVAGITGVPAKVLAERTTRAIDSGFAADADTIKGLLAEVVKDDGNQLGATAGAGSATTTAAPTPAPKPKPTPPPKPVPPPKPPPAGPEMAAQIVDSINEHLGSDDTDYDRPRAARAKCTNDGYCEASYNADTPVFDTEGELIDAQRPIFKDAFGIRKLRSLTLTTRGQVTTVGGKELVDDVMEIICDRAANREIDWDNVDAGGVKQICIYQALVKL